MKKFFYMAVAAIAALSSCSSDNDIINDNENQNEKVEAPVFTATIEGEAATRTTLVEGTKVYWSNGDKIKINGVEYTTTSTTNEATFTPVSAEATAIQGKYIAVYPSNIALDLATSTVTLPATQTYDTQTNGIDNVPMAAVSTTTSLEFKNVCTVLAVKVASGTVKKIKVMADKNLSGDFILNPLDFSFTASIGSNTVVLDCSEANSGAGVTANNTTFYIAIPPQAYSHLQIYLSADGSTYKEAMATKVASGLGTLVRNKIINITYAKNAVQLWADGPYFATMNVGETTETGNTQTYKWGATVAGDEGSENTGSYDLDHDTAYKIWGSAWRMPTKEEFTALNTNKSSVSYGQPNGTYGFTIQGATGYGSIFLPADGYADASYGNACYWSATPDDDYAYRLNLSYDGTDLEVLPNYLDERNYVYFVRAVLR